MARARLGRDRSSSKGALYESDNRKVGSVDAKRTVDAGGGYTVGVWRLPRRGLRVRYGLALDVSAASADRLVVCPPMFAHDVDRIEENLQGDGFFTLEIRVEIGKRNVQRSGKTLFRSEDLQSAAHCRQCH